MIRRDAITAMLVLGAAVHAWRAQALTASSEYVLHARRRVIDFALQQRLPSAFPAVEMVESGGLLSYGVSRASLIELFNAGLGYVDRILRGARPAELPVQRPTRFDLIVNLATAKALGVEVPQSVLLRANRVIE